MEEDITSLGTPSRSAASSTLKSVTMLVWNTCPGTWPVGLGIAASWSAASASRSTEVTSPQPGQVGMHVELGAGLVVEPGDVRRRLPVGVDHAVPVGDQLRDDVAPDAAGTAEDGEFHRHGLCA